MFNESPRTTKLIAGGLTVLAMGFGGIAMADKPGDGTAGNAMLKSNPGGQILGGDDNNGWRCDEGNKGAGAGNPAFGPCGGTADNFPTGTTKTKTPGNGGGKTGGDDYVNSGS